MSSLKKIDYILIISLLFISTFLTQFIFRPIDDNRLTSWAWVFDNIDATKIYFILILGIVLAYLISKVPSENTLLNPPSSPFAKGGMGGLFSFPKHNPATFLFLLSFIIALPFWKESEVIVDASRYFTQAKHLEIHGIGYFLREWGKEITAWTDLPVIPFFYGLIFKFLGESRLCIQIFTTFLFSMTVLLTYQIGKIQWDESTGFFAGLLLLGIPYIFTQVPLMLVDVPTMFFLILSIFTFIMALEHGRAWIPFSSIAIFFAFFSKYSAWLMLSVLIIIFLVYLKTALVIPPQTTLETNPPSPPFNSPLGKGGNRGVKGGMGGLRRQGRTVFCRGSITILIAGILIGAVLLYKFNVFSEQINLLLSYQKPGLERWGESFTSTFFFQIHPFITIAALYSIYVGFKKKDLRYIIISYLVLLMVLLQIKRIRYIIMVFPMLALMASYGLEEIKNKELKRFIILCIVISSIVVAIFAYLPFVQKVSTVNLKNAGDFLDSLDIENIEVFTLPQINSTVNPAVSVSILDLFTKKKIYFDYNPPSPPFNSPLDKGGNRGVKGGMGGLTGEEILKSQLRFTWEYKNPEYYSGTNRISEGNTAVVVISRRQDDIIPSQIEKKIRGYHNSKVFKTDEGVFHYRPIVSIFW